MIRLGVSYPMKTLTHDGIEIALRTEVLAEPWSEVEKAESSLGCEFPSDYKRLITLLGSGEFQPMPIRLLAPRLILQNLEEDKAVYSECWDWTDSPEVWDQERALESVACFDGYAGDAIRFHPSNPNRMYILSRSATTIEVVTSFAELIDYYRHEFDKGQSLTFRSDKYWTQASD
jgi:hypothetical protein